MARRSDHSREEIREMTLNAAEELVSKQGLTGLSARKIATAIGYTPGTLYLVFKNLDELILHLNARILDHLYAYLEARQSEQGTPRERLVTLAHAYIDFATANTPLWNVLFEDVVADADQLPAWYTDRLTRVFGLVERALSPLADHHNETTIRQAARVLWASVHGICILKIRQRLDLAGGQSVEEMAEMLLDNFLAGFSARKS
ncbi:TetR/AcrR family transcriptional regulator [Thiohalomonas denitrificans]|uniref:Transcriptional regulator, TetR family n=1 Tax=Thiohalomonas denitrificans TaxID=415747 RepID=A0A1G5QTJ4_9GAMM|nr:WHG domain-containing protein [Thiohalomonas denitrificans]SCZ64870.1 transcriptional regulator, TetR family [Thiohalomonas denitrificans]